MDWDKANQHSKSQSKGNGFFLIFKAFRGLPPELALYQEVWIMGILERPHP
jgi:hypothetical protein